MDKIPITSNLFKAEHALKRVEPKPKETNSNPLDSPAAVSATPTAAVPAVVAPATVAPAMPAPLNPAQYMFIPGQMPQMMPQMYPQMYPQMLPQMLPPMLPPMLPQMPWNGQVGTGMPTTPASTGHLDPPLSPVSTECDISEWCTKYKLDEESEAGLERLGFVVGDNLDEVTEKEYTEAGFKALAWRRVLKAYHRYRRDRK